MATSPFTQLEVWKRSHALALAVYRVAETFPRREHFGLAAQMRSAAASIGANIAEGFGRRPLRDKARFYNTAEGSAYELENFLLLAEALGFLEEIASMASELATIGRMLSRLVDRTLQAAEGADRFGPHARPPRV